MDSIYDYIIVRGGTAGVVVASRLKQCLPESRITLIEAGPNAVDHPKVKAVSREMAWVPLLSEGLVVDYSTMPQEYLNNRELPIPAGRLLSGSSGVNVGLWMRPSYADCEVLATKAGSGRFKFKNLIKYMKRLETHYDAKAANDYHDFEGPIHTIGGRKYPMSGIVQQSAYALGHAHNADAYKGDLTGLSAFVQAYRATSLSTARRQHSAKVFDLGGLDVICDAPVARILFDESKRATSIELLSGKRVLASKEVIVSCGAQKTLQLLMLSGIGPTAELARHSIPIVVDAPAVGENLFDRAALHQHYKLKAASKGFAHPFTGTSQLEYGHGIPVENILLANIPAAELTPYLQVDGLNADKDSSPHLLLLPKRTHIMCIPMYFPVFAHPVLYPTVKEDNTHIALMSFNMLPLSRGTITLKSADPKDNPICNPRLLSTNTDRFILRRAVRENFALVETEPFASEIEGEVAPADPRFPALTTKSNDEEIDVRIRAFSGTVFHLMGTCALGTVLDGNFRIKGV